jgi:hypothetical protein
MKYLLNLTILFALLTPSCPLQAQQATPIEKQQIEYRQISAEARKNLVDEIVNTLQRNAVEQVSFWVRILSGVLAITAAVLAIFGWRGLRNLRLNITNDTQTFMRTSPEFSSLLKQEVSKGIDEGGSVIYKKARLHYTQGRLEMLAREIDNKSSFSNAERDVLIELLEEVGNDKDERAKPAFAQMLEKVVDSFAGADLEQFIDDLDDRFRDVTARHLGVLQTMVIHYGARVVAATEIDPKLQERFGAYIIACAKNKVPEIILPYQMVNIFIVKGKQWQSILKGYFDQAKYMDTEDLGRFVRVFDRRTDKKNEGKWETAKQERVHLNFVLFCNDNSGVLNTLRDKVPTLD